MPAIQYNTTASTNFEKKVFLFRVIYTEFWFNGKTHFMGIGKRLFKTSTNEFFKFNWLHPWSYNTQQE